MFCPLLAGAKGEKAGRIRNESPAVLLRNSPGSWMKMCAWEKCEPDKSLARLLRYTCVDLRGSTSASESFWSDL